MRTIEYQYKNIVWQELTQAVLLFMLFGLLAWVIDIGNATLLYVQILLFLLTAALLRAGLKCYWIHTETLSLNQQQLYLRDAVAEVHHSASWLNKQTLLIRAQHAQTPYCVRVERVMVTRQDWLLLEQCAEHCERAPSMPTHQSPQP